LSQQSVLPRTILVAIDGSEPSFKAVAYAIELGKLAKSRIICLHVLLLPSFATTQTLQTLRKDLSPKSDEMLARARKMAVEREVQIEGKIVETSRSVVMAIVDSADKDKADLIIVGTSGTSGMGKLMLGSVAAGTVSSAHCPVLAVR